MPEALTVEPMAYRTGDAARVLGLSPDMVKKLRREGKLRGFMVGGARLYSAEELRRFLTEQEALAG
jgi:excisionase family DNA binding protein